MSQFVIPVPLSKAIKTYSDLEIIEVISGIEYRLKKNKYDVNEAALCLYDTARTEWFVRYGKKPCPKIIALTEFIFEGDIDENPF